VFPAKFRRETEAGGGPQKQRVRRDGFVRGVERKRGRKEEKKKKNKNSPEARISTCLRRSEKKIQSAATRCGEPVIKFATANQVRASGSMPAESHNSRERGNWVVQARRKR